MTNQKFVKFCKTAKDKLVMYMWGDYGRPITEANIADKAKQYPIHYDKAYQAVLRTNIGTGIGCDCTGLIKWFLWTKGDINAKVVYDGNTDNSAGGWYRAAHEDKRGLIDTIPLDREGLIVSMEGHCGVYIGGGNVIECTKGTLNGVYHNGIIMTNLSDRPWEKWCECPYITYGEEMPDSAINFINDEAHVKAQCFAYADLKRRTKIGTVFAEDIIGYIGDYGDMAAVIYPTAASYKIAFIDKSNIQL